MDTWFELWNAEHANLIGSFESQDDALATVRSLMRHPGTRDLDALVLTRTQADERDEETQSDIADGSGLAELARRAAAVPR